MSYNELIGLVRETNRPPGGMISLQVLAQRLHLNPSTRVMEIGCATGWTALELGQLTGCKIYAIDINEESINEARQRARNRGLDNVEFHVADAAKVPLPDGWADVVFCGNVTALVSDPERVIAEYKRVLKPGGFLVAIPMYYRTKPSDELVKEVREAIQVNIPVLYRDTALEFYQSFGLETFEAHDFAFDERSEADVEAFVSSILRRPHLGALTPEEQGELATTYGRHMQLFRRNLAIMGYTVLLLRKPYDDEDPELFTARQVPEPAL
jgi:SAM-dependent methyltransferase